MHSSGRGVFAPAHRALTLGILLSITAVAFEGMAVATIMPSVAVELGGLDGYGWAFSTFMLTSLVGAIGAGQIADRRSATLPACLGFASFAAGLLVASAAPLWLVLLLGRAVQGFGAGALGSIAYVAVARGYPEPLRPRLLALLASAWIVPSLVGPALAGQVAEHATWRLVFVGIVPPVALGAWMLLPALARLPQTADKQAESRMGTGGVVAPAAVAPADIVDERYALFRAEPDSVAAPPPVARSASADTERVVASVRLTLGVFLVLLAASVDALPAALALGAIGVVLAAPALRVLLPRATFAVGPGLPAAVALRGLLAFGFFATETVIPLGLTTLRAMPPSVVGLALTSGALAWVSGTWVQDRAEAAARGSLPRRAIRVAAAVVLMAAAIVAVAFAVISPDLPIQLVMLAWALAGLGMGLAYPATTLTALGMALFGQEGSASAALLVAETVGIATGTGAAGALFALAGHLDRATSDGLAWGFLLALLSLVLAVAPALRLAPVRHRPLVRWRAKTTS